MFLRVATKTQAEAEAVNMDEGATALHAAGNIAIAMNDVLAISSVPHALLSSVEGVRSQRARKAPKRYRAEDAPEETTSTRAAPFSKGRAKK